MVLLTDQDFRFVGNGNMFCDSYFNGPVAVAGANGNQDADFEFEIRGGSGGDDRPTTLVRRIRYQTMTND